MPASAKCSRATSSQWTETYLDKIRSFAPGAYAPRRRRCADGPGDQQRSLHQFGLIVVALFGEFGGVTQFIANPNLFTEAAAVHAAIATWPLQPARVLNGAA